MLHLPPCQIRYFNSQPHEEADSLMLRIISMQSYFNSQPHEEADSIRRNFVAIVLISTHSLTKRLTVAVDVASLTQELFQLTASRRG